MSFLKVFLLDHPRIELDGVVISFPRRKVLALFIYLVVTGRTHNRDSLSAFLWPEYDSAKASANLRRNLSILKSLIPENLLQIFRDEVVISKHPELFSDIERLHFCVSFATDHDHPDDTGCDECIDLLFEATELYGAGFLAGFSLRDSRQFDEWQTLQSEICSREVISAYQMLVSSLYAKSDYEQALVCTENWINLDPLNEFAHRQLMVLQAESGRRSDALRQYGKLKNLLESELQVSPDEETRRLFSSLKESRNSVSKNDVSIASFANNLPAQPTPFIGRE
ncbi:MAG: hypothetical protein HN368_24540, partial [Spirochaetales bacterium]|nr:hypothetical protein [Spirochaetales bacterium]